MKITSKEATHSLSTGTSLPISASMFSPSLKAGTMTLSSGRGRSRNARLAHGILLLAVRFHAAAPFCF